MEEPEQNKNNSQLAYEFAPVRDDVPPSYPTPSKTDVCPTTSFTQEEDYPEADSFIDRRGYTPTDTTDNPCIISADLYEYGTDLNVSLKTKGIYHAWWYIIDGGFPHLVVGVENIKISDIAIGTHEIEIYLTGAGHKRYSDPCTNKKLEFSSYEDSTKTYILESCLQNSLYISVKHRTGIQEFAYIDLDHDDYVGCWSFTNLNPESVDTLNTSPIDISGESVYYGDFDFKEESCNCCDTKECVVQIVPPILKTKPVKPPPAPPPPTITETKERFFPPNITCSAELIVKQQASKATTSPFSINGYYPLYSTEEESNAASNGNGSSHFHILNSITYYMPNGLGGPGSGTQFHGDYINEILSVTGNQEKNDAYLNVRGCPKFRSRQKYYVWIRRSDDCNEEWINNQAPFVFELISKAECNCTPYLVPITNNVEDNLISLKLNSEGTPVYIVHMLISTTNDASQAGKEYYERYIDRSKQEIKTTIIANNNTDNEIATGNIYFSPSNKNPEYFNAFHTIDVGRTVSRINKIFLSEFENAPEFINTVPSLPSDSSGGGDSGGGDSGGGDSGGGDSGGGGSGGGGSGGGGYGGYYKDKGEKS